MAFMAALPAIIGGISSAYGAASANRQTQRNAQASMVFESLEAQKNREFQERMSGSAHQREVQDLIKAGLNPMLSVMGGSGASTPGGDSARGSQAPVQNELGAGVSSALAAANIAAQNKLLGAQANQANAGANLANASATIPATIGDVVNGIKKFLGDSTGTDTAGVLHGMRGGLTNVLESISNSAGAARRVGGGALEAGRGVLQRGFETMKNSAGSIGADGVELLRRVDDMIGKANDRFSERMKRERGER